MKTSSKTLVLAAVIYGLGAFNVYADDSLGVSLSTGDTSVSVSTSSSDSTTTYVEEKRMPPKDMPQDGRPHFDKERPHDLRPVPQDFKAHNDSNRHPGEMGPKPQGPDFRHDRNNGHAPQHFADNAHNPKHNGMRDNIRPDNKNMKPQGMRNPDLAKGANRNKAHEVTPSLNTDKKQLGNHG